MGKYTTYNEPWIDEAIDSHLQVMVEKVRANLPSVLSIFLVGGFGRGEGSVQLAQNHQLRPINDYDVYLITKRPVQEEKLNKIARQIEQAIGSQGYSLYGHSKKEFYFDIRAITINKLRKLLPLIKYYEFKHASILVFGKDLRGLIPKFNKKDLPFSDALRFLLNRICHITEWFSVNYLEHKPVKDWEKETLIYDISKTYLECCTILTLLKGYYQPTYQLRLEQLILHEDEFEELWQRFPDFLSKIKYFTIQKLQPNFKEIKDIKKVWFETREYALWVLGFVLRKKYGARNWRDFKSIAIKNYFKPYLALKLPKIFLPLANLLLHKYLNLLWFFRLIKFKKIVCWSLIYGFTDPGILIFDAALSMVQIIKKDGSLDQELMSKSIKTLKSIYPIKDIKYDFIGYEKLRKMFSDIWRLYYFQKLI